jgi:hypothetical protein
MMRKHHLHIIVGEDTVEALEYARRKLGHRSWRETIEYSIKRLKEEVSGAG